MCGVCELKRLGVEGRGGRGLRAIQCVANLRARIERSRECYGDGLLEEMRTHRCSPRRDAHRVQYPVGIPFPQPGQLLLKMNRGRQVFLEMFHHLGRVEVRGKIARRIVTRMGIGHVPREYAFEARLCHRAQSHRLSKETHLRVKTEVDQMGQSIFLTDGVNLRLSIRHQVACANHQVRVHAVPSVIDRAPFTAAGASAGVRHRRTRHIHHLGRHHIRQRKDDFALRVACVVLHHIART